MDGYWLELVDVFCSLGLTVILSTIFKTITGHRCIQRTWKLSCRSPAEVMCGVTTWIVCAWFMQHYSSSALTHTEMRRVHWSSPAHQNFKAAQRGCSCLSTYLQTLQHIWALKNVNDNITFDDNSSDYIFSPNNLDFDRLGDSLYIQLWLMLWWMIPTNHNIFCTKNLILHQMLSHHLIEMLIIYIYRNIKWNLSLPLCVIPTHKASFGVYVRRFSHEYKARNSM